MLSLEAQAGCCRGLAFRIAAGSVQAESAILWRREMLRGGYSPGDGFLLKMAHAAGIDPSLAFVSNVRIPSYVGELPLNETAAMIAHGKGILGTNREYLAQLATQLQALRNPGTLCRAIIMGRSMRA